MTETVEFEKGDIVWAIMPSGLAGYMIGIKTYLGEDYEADEILAKLRAGGMDVHYGYDGFTARAKFIMRMSGGKYDASLVESLGYNGATGEHVGTTLLVESWSIRKVKDGETEPDIITDTRGPRSRTMTKVKEKDDEPETETTGRDQDGSGQQTGLGAWVLRLFRKER